MPVFPAHSFCNTVSDNKRRCTKNRQQVLSGSKDPRWLISVSCSVFLLVCDMGMNPLKTLVFLIFHLTDVKFTTYPPSETPTMWNMNGKSRTSMAVTLAAPEENYKNICRYFETFSYFRVLGVFLVTHAKWREEGATPRLACHRQSILLGGPCTQTPSSSTSKPGWKTPWGSEGHHSVYTGRLYNLYTKPLECLQIKYWRSHTHTFTHNKIQQWKSITHIPHTPLKRINWHHEQSDIRKNTTIKSSNFNKKRNLLSSLETSKNSLITRSTKELDGAFKHSTRAKMNHLLIEIMSNDQAGHKIVMQSLCCCSTLFA